MTWASGSTLSIWNWTEGADHLFFDRTTLGLTNSQLSAIHFYRDNGDTELNTPAFTNGLSGEVAPVPEPSVVVAAFSLLALTGFRERRRLRVLVAK